LDRCGCNVYLVVQYNSYGDIGEDDEDEPPVPALAADLAAHPWLSELQTEEAKMSVPGSWGALVDTALALRLRSLQLGNVTMCAELRRLWRAYSALPPRCSGCGSWVPGRAAARYTS
jgi:hypothetical protein